MRRSALLARAAWPHRTGATAIAAGLALGLAWLAATAAAEDPRVRFEIVVPPPARTEPTTGRVFVMLSHTNQQEPRFQVGRTGVPVFGRDVSAVAPGDVIVVDETDLGTPLESLKDIPPGTYYVQAMVSVYSEFRRADGHVVWMHDDRWEGQDWRRSPGNLYSDTIRVAIDPTKGSTVRLTADRVVPEVTVPPDTREVRRFRFESPMLSRFWGRPIHLGATVLLPAGYDDETISYPVLYEQGHFSLSAPMGFEPATELGRVWLRPDFPRMVVVTFQHPTPYFDDSYAVNSVNVGPYGDALMEELIPEVERRFRIIREPWARLLAGGSTGGWEALALQIFHPDFFGGTWAYCPDPVSFSDVEMIDIYEDENAYYKRRGWRTVVTPNTREINGEIRLTSRQRNYYELVMGTKGRSGEQFDAWSASFGPLGPDGFFQPLFDKVTGVIDPAVAGYWRQHYDLLYYLQRNWSAVGPKLIDKLRIYTGTMDNFYLNNSVREMEQWMRTTTNPHYPGSFQYGEGRGHCWAGLETPVERLREMAAHLVRHTPAGAATPWWRN